MGPKRTESEKERKIEIFKISTFTYEAIKIYCGIRLISYGLIPLKGFGVGLQLGRCQRYALRAFVLVLNE